MRHPAVLAIAVIAAAAGPAHALKPADHASITYAACVATGLPRDFCTRTATEDYNTDAREWDDLAAHAQIDGDQTACAGADAAAARVYQLGGALRSALAAVHTAGGDANVAATASALGRALHTLQDNCAHHGMPNPQHAWFSLSDFCDGTELSPDIQDDALACARTETAAAMAIAAQLIRGAGSNVVGWLDARSCPPSPSSGHNSTTPPSVCQSRFLPGPIDGCSFLGEAHAWDGIDRTWKNPVVITALRGGLQAGATGAAAPGPTCRGGDETVLSPAVSQPIVDVSAGPASCVRASVFCLGKADDTDSPFAGEAAPTTDAGGCAATTGRSSVLGLALVAAALRRRRRHSTTTI